ncbi:M14 family zinc carboxypeptidase [Bacillus sp. AK128]
MKTSRNILHYLLILVLVFISFPTSALGNTQVSGQYYSANEDVPISIESGNGLEKIGILHKGAMVKSDAIKESDLYFKLGDQTAIADLNLFSELDVQIETISSDSDTKITLLSDVQLLNESNQATFVTLNKGTSLTAYDITDSTISFLIGNETYSIALDQIQYELLESKESLNFDQYFKVIEDQAVLYLKDQDGVFSPVGSLLEGQEFEIIEDAGEYHKVKVNNLTGYVTKEGTVPSDGTSIGNGDLPNGQKTKSISIITHVSVYDNSSGSLVPFATLGEGTVYKYYNKSGNWYIVEVGGRLGYIYKSGVRELQVEQESNINYKYFTPSKEIPVYMNQNGALTPVGMLTQGQSYTYVAEYGNWYQINFANQTGFVWKAATEKTNNGFLNNQRNLSPMFSVKVTEPLSVFDNTSGALVEYAKINSGQSITVISDVGNWLGVNIGGRYGFIYKPGTQRSFTAEDQFYKVLEEDITVYKQHNGSLAPIGKLLKNQEFTRLKDYGNWHQVQFGSDLGFVWKEATKPIHKITEGVPAGSSSPLKVRFTQDSRVFDNSTGELIPFAVVYKGSTYSVIKDYGNWVGINISGKLGFVHKSGFVREFTPDTKFFTTIQENVSIYQTINGKLVPVGKLEKGMEYKRMKDAGNWHEIQYGHTVAYVWKDATVPASGVSYKGQNHAAQLQLQVKTLTNVTVYDNSSGTLIPFASINEGTTYPIIEESGNWYKVFILNKVGYIYKKATTTVAAKIVNPRQVYSYYQMQKDLTALKIMYPDLVQLTTIGKSVDGRNLYALKLGKGPKEVFINGSHHAREHMTTNVVMEMIDSYALAYTNGKTIDQYNVKDLLEKTSIWFVPMVNPDGVMLVQQGHKSAKNPNEVLRINGGKTDFTAWKANIRGVDLNRQYPADWDNIRNNKGKPSYMNFKGYKPLSEPEVIALYQFTLQHDFKTAVSYHSSGEILYWHFHQDSARYARDYALAKQISNKTGYRMVAPQSNPSGGGYTDWFISTMKKPGFTPEISPYVVEQPVPLYYYDRIWQQNFSIGLMMADYASKQ